MTKEKELEQIMRRYKLMQETLVHILERMETYQGVKDYDINTIKEALKYAERL
jgi:hypothetical protein